MQILQQTNALAREKRHLLCYFCSFFAGIKGLKGYYETALFQSRINKQKKGKKGKKSKVILSKNE